jgi:hypothetical protein
MPDDGRTTTTRRGKPVAAEILDAFARFSRSMAAAYGAEIQAFLHDMYGRRFVDPAAGALGVIANGWILCSSAGDWVVRGHSRRASGHVGHDRTRRLVN